MGTYVCMYVCGTEKWIEMVVNGYWEATSSRNCRYVFAVNAQYLAFAMFVAKPFSVISVQAISAMALLAFNSDRRP